MSFLQDLQGVKVIPSPALRDGDGNGDSYFDKNPRQWPQGYAFGGWIFDAQVSLGFSKRPTQVVLNIVLEKDSTINELQKFDIKDRLLEISLITDDNNGGSALDFDDEYWLGHYYSIHLHGVKFNRMYLYDYSINVDASQKVLTVTFKDYSVILDKIYVGLTKRQGPGRIPSAMGEDPNTGERKWQPRSLCGPNAGYNKRDYLLRQGEISSTLTSFCPNCYLVNDGFNPTNNPKLAGSYGAYLGGFFQKQTGTLYRKSWMGSFIGRPHPNRRFEVYDDSNLTEEKELPEYKRSKACYDITMETWRSSGGIGSWGMADSTTSLSDGTGIDCRDASSNPRGWPHSDFNAANMQGSPVQSSLPIYSFDQLNTIRFPFYSFWDELHKKVFSGETKEVGFTIDGGYLMIGSEEFTEQTCGSAPNISYNLTELLNSLRFRGLDFKDLEGQKSPDKNPRFRANYIGTLREVLEQWCGVFSLDYYYKDMAGSDEQGFHFLDLEEGANIQPIRGVVDPSTDIGKEFGATDEQESVVLSYKESSTLENTYIQSCITSNVKPFTVKERTKIVKRYVPMLPLHPCDFSLPNYEKQLQTSLLGETYFYSKIANFIPWYSEPQNKFTEAGNTFWDHRKRMWNRTNREIWDMDISMALCRLDDNLRDLYVANRICENALSEVSPLAVYPVGHKRAGDIIPYLQGANGSPGAEATEQQIKNGVDTIGKRLNHNPGVAGSRPTTTEEKDLKANFEALGFQELMEIEDFMVKENIVLQFLKQQEIEDVSLDVSHLKMFVGYYDEQIHQQHKEWEKRCAESMYGFAAVFGGTLPVEPFIPRDYYGVRDGDLGFGENTCGVSIPKLNNSFEPAADQYPHYSLEALDAPFKGLLVNSGMYLPTGLYIAPIDNPWGTSVEEWEKEFWRSFSDNACTEYNNSLNIIEDAGFNLETVVDKDGRVTYKKNTDQFPFKKQDWSLKMFTPKFFKDSEQILDSADGVIQSLYDDGRLVDEVSLNRRTVEYGEQRYCKKLTIMVINDTRPSQHPNISFEAKYANEGNVNPMIRRQRELWEIAEHKRKAKDDLRNRCDRDLVFEFCEDAIQQDKFNTFENRILGGEVDKSTCAIDPTGVYREGFDREIVGGYYYPDTSILNNGMPNSRGLEISLVRNPNIVGFIPTSEDGEYHLMDLEEDMQVLPTEPLNFLVQYPVNNYKMIVRPGEGGYNQALGGYFQKVPVAAGALNNVGHQFYSGIWEAQQTLEDRRPELIEIYGEPPATNNPTAGIRVVNNAIDPDLEAMIDPDRGGFMTKLFDNEGRELRSIEEYHNLIAYGYRYGGAARSTDKPSVRGLNDFGVVRPNKKIDLKLAGSLENFKNFKSYCDPQYGLQDLSISFTDQGVQTSLSFGDRPPQAPQMEGILNKIGPRTM